MEEGKDVEIMMVHKHTASFYVILRAHMYVISNIVVYGLNMFET